MAPKRKVPSASTGTPKKKEKPEAEDNFRLTRDALKAAPRETRKARVDSVCPLSSSPTAQVSLVHRVPPSSKELVNGFVLGLAAWPRD